MWVKNVIAELNNGCKIIQTLIDNLTIKNLRTAFYLVTPNETTFYRVEDVPQYTDQSITWFLLLIVLESIYWTIKEKRFKNNPYFFLNDSITSLNAGLTSQLFKISDRTVTLVLYTWIYENYQLVDLPIDSIYLWILAFLAQDFLYYRGHRFMHEVGIFWAFHQTHHSSEYYNLTTALRQNIFQDIGLIGFECVQSLFMPPPMFMVHKYLNALYQFGIHNEVFPKLGPLELILNTPSHHRVHHGRNPYCIDKNYGAVLIIWDRIFGTFEPEKSGEKPVYGLVENVNTFNQFYVQLFEFKNLGWNKPHKVDDTRWEVFPSLLSKIKALFMPPGWWPGMETVRTWFWLRLKNPAEGVPEVEETVIKYHKPLKFSSTLYVVAQFGLTNFAYIQFSESRSTLSWGLFFAYLCFILSAVQSIGFMLDKKWYAYLFELFRLFLIIIYCLFSGNSLIFLVEMISILHILFFIFK